MVKKSGNIAVAEKNTDITGYSDQISRKKTLEARLSVVKEAIGIASSDMNTKRMKTVEAHTEISRFLQDNKNENIRTHKDQDHLEPYHKEQLDKLTDLANTADREESEAKKRFDELTVEINDLENQLLNFKYLIGAEDVLNFQEDIAAVDQKVTELQRSISEQELIIKQAEAGIIASDSDSLVRNRQNLLADIALGKASQEDLNQLDKKIAETNKATADSHTNAKATIEPARQTIIGLQRRLDEATGKLNALKEKKNEVIFHYLMNRAEMLGEEYINLAKKLVSKFSELVALDRIMGYPHRLVRADFNSEIFIPLFSLSAFKGIEHPNYPGHMREAKNALNESLIIQAVESERSRIKALGIEL